MNYKKIISLLMTLILITACSKTEEVNKKETTKTVNDSDTELHVENEKLDEEAEKALSLAKEMIFASNASSKEEYGEQLKKYMMDYAVPYYQVEWDYDYMKNVENVSFYNYQKVEDGLFKQIHSQVEMEYINSEQTPIQQSYFVVINYKNDQEEGIQLKDVYFYIDEEDYKTPAYLMRAVNTKNLTFPYSDTESPELSHFELEAFIEPTNDNDEIEEEATRHYYLLYEALVLETNPVEYNRKVMSIMHSSVAHDYLIDENVDFIPRELITMKVSSLSLEYIEWGVNRESYTYEGVISLSFTDKDGGKHPVDKMVIVEFAKDTDGAYRIMSIK